MIKHAGRAAVSRIIVTLLGLLLTSDLLEGQDGAGRATITYLTASSAYVDAGTEQGIAVGSRLEVIRRDSVVAVLRAAYVSTRRTSCTIESRTVELAIGDQVRYQALVIPDSAADEPRPRVAADSVPVPAPVRSRGTGAIHGRVGVRYLVARQTDGDAEYSQPALDLRLDGPIGGSGLSLGVDVRARRTSSLLGDGSRDENQVYRVYQLALAWNPARSPFRFTAGRQFSAPLASVNFFDGLMAEYSRPRWGAGLLVGTQPDPVSFGFSGITSEAGGYFQLHSGPGTASRWTLTSGVVGSYQSGEVNREFGFLQASLFSKQFSFYLSQEVDYNRSWKAAAGEPAISPTSTYANISIRPAGGISLRAGFDNRRNVRLYRDFVNPVTVFDDAYRQGVWGGISLFKWGYRLGLDARNSTGGSAGSARVFTGSVGSDRLAGTGLSLRARSTRYLSDTNRGWLHSATLGITPSHASHLEATGGWRSNFDALDDPETSRLSWIGVDFDLSLGRAWYLLVSVSHESGSDDAMNQVFGGLSLRF